MQTKTRDWFIYADFAHVLITIALELYRNDDFGLELDETVYAPDALTIGLCLFLFPWARFRKMKGAIKLHTRLDLRGSILSFIAITEGNVHDVNVLDELIPEPGALYIVDRGYLDFECVYLLNRCMAFLLFARKATQDFVGFTLIK